MLKRLIAGLLALAVVGLVGLGVFAWRPAIGKIDPPAPSSFAPDLVARGEALAGAGYCSTCHTSKGGQPFAGGYPMKTGFGTIYSTNITPDPGTGIGTWSEAAFRRAMHEGVARDGAHLLPVFPYDHFTKLSDDDVSALYAYMMTRPPVVASAKRNSVPFPLNIRALQAGWKLLFFKPGRFEPDAAKSAEWNRGAYLAEGVSHCGACHTPRNALGAEKRGKAYAGALIDGWVAPPLTAANPSPAPWDQAELTAYLRTGVSRYHGVAAGPMAPVVHDGLIKLPGADIRALAIYFADVDGAAGRGGALAPALRRAAVADRLNVGPQNDPAARLYTAACASCHYNGVGQPNPLRPDLALNSAVNLDDPTNLIRVVLYGVSAKDGAPGVVMPGFNRFSDAEVARLATYLRATRTDKPAWPNLEKKVAAIRAQGK
ncbi:cytochrome c [Caulobacter segnis]|uniref:Gluconate 2-dehydrogenase (Acceptor) n=2 Tax=Caulobacter segnis TaxID=88688 RepID=D5VGG1_CAUST|nr:cytochrome c [Caulobacter segnis]ADG10280.1 Gluconate 2-dehydrogenase (acceptor) [Caulobacter segnis ATCC 21756]AVQ02017.1 cytochrome c [Caulobacter segnis]